MKAVYKEVLGNKSSKFVYEEAAPLPSLQPDYVLIRTKACSVSHTDNEILQLLYKNGQGGKYPVGQDVSGVVIEVGHAVTTLKHGDEVVGIIPLDYGFSGCAEYVALHEFDVTKKPENVSFVDAAGGIGDAIKAYTALHYLGRMSVGDTVLVMDGASSFGSLTIQLASHWGAKVITTASSDDEKLYLESLSSHVALVVDLSKKPTSTNGFCGDGSGGNLYSACMEETGMLGVDLIIDNGVTQFSRESDKKIADDFYLYPTPSKQELISTLAIGGRWITCNEKLQLDPPNSRILHMKCASIGFLFEHAWTLSSSQQGRYLHILMDIMEKISDGVIRPNIHHTIPFESVIDGITRLQDIRVGKVVMKME